MLAFPLVTALRVAFPLVVAGVALILVGVFTGGGDWVPALVGAAWLVLMPLTSINTQRKRHAR